MSEALQRELDSYKRALQREKQARTLAETQLEDFSREIYQAKFLLDEQTEQVKSKQQHLAFLISVAEDNWPPQSVSDVVNQYLQKSCVFLERPFAAYFQIEKDNSISNLQIAKSTSSSLESLIDEDASEHVMTKRDVDVVLKSLDLATLKQEYIEHNRGALFETERYLMSGEQGKLAEQSNSDVGNWHIYLMPIFHHKQQVLNKLTCMCFFYKDYNDVDLLKLETMEASHSIFSVALERKKAETVLKKKLVELQQTNDNLQQIQQQLIES